MINKKFLFCIAILFTCITSFSQTKNYIYYFDKDLNSVQDSTSILKGIGEYQNGLFALSIYNTQNKNLVILEHFKDSSLQISDGLFASYYDDKSKEWEGNYSEGKQDGLWKQSDKQGRTIDSSIYDNGEKIMTANFTYYSLNDGVEILRIDSLKTGKVTQIVFDENRKIVSRTSFKEDEDPDMVFTKVEIEASFPGGPASWQRYVTKVIQQYIDQFTDKDYGTCIVRFIVDKTGKISNVEAITMKGTKLSEIAVDAIKKGPNWVPAQQNGRFVNAYRLQPVTLQNPNE